MELDDIRAYATATQRVARAVEESGAVAPTEILETVDVATRNPVLGFGMVCGLASRAGIDFWAIDGVGETLSRVSLTDGADLEPAEQGAYRVAYVQAVNASERADEPVTVHDAAEALGVTRGRVHQLVSEGKLERVPTDRKAVNARGAVLIRRGSLESLVRERSRTFDSGPDDGANER